MKLFVWDFHGVLEKGNDYAVIEITNYVLEKFGYKRRLTEIEAKLLNGKKWFEYFAFLLPDEEFHLHRKLQSACFIRAEKNPHITKKHLKINDNANNVLEKIYRSEHDQILISNTQQNALLSFLEMIDIKKYFQDENIFGLDAHTNPKAQKKEVLLNFLQNKTYDAIISIGDSKHDVELALLHNRGKSYLYAHPGRAYNSCEPNNKTNTLLDILKEI